MMTRILTALVLLAATFGVLAQSPQPIVVQAAQAPAATASVLPPSAPEGSAADSETLRTLQELRKSNDETLQKQEAALKALDELQKAAEQIRIYTKRS